MTIDEARFAYGKIAKVLKSERANRERFLTEPRRTAAIAEIDDALAALTSLAAVFQVASVAGILESVPVQASLIDLPDSKPPYV